MASEELDHLLAETHLETLVQARTTIEYWKALDADKRVQIDELVLTDRDLVPIVEVFVHVAFDFSPLVRYLTCREGSDLESLETVQPQVSNKQHMDYKVIELVDLGHMDVAPAALGHTTLEPVGLGHKGLRPDVLGHKDFPLVVLRHKDFGPIALGQKDLEPVALGHQDLGSPTAGIDPNLVLAKVDPVDMSIRVVATWVVLATTRVDLATAKVVPMIAEVSLTKTQDGRFAKHTAFVAAWFVATVARVSPMDIVVVLVVALFSLPFAWTTLVAPKVTLVATEVVLVAARVLKQFSE